MPATSQNAPFRSCVMTIYGVENYDSLPEGLTYFAYGHEICPSTQRPHLQAFAYATKAQRWSWWQKKFEGHHIERMEGTFAQNEKYCSKQNELIEFGTRPMANGKKRTLQDLCDQVTEGAEEGKPLRDIIMEGDQQSTFVQYHGGITKLHAMAVNYKLSKVDKDFAPEVIYVWGPPGGGKSRYVREQDPYVYDVPEDDSYKWKDGYSGQDAVVYENVSVNNLKCPERLLKEIDRYFIQVAVKGGFTGWRPKRIYITSVFSPNALAEQAGFSKPDELLRRITKIVPIAVPELSFAPP